MKKLKVYLDTSIISFLYADDSPEYQKATQDFFDNYLNDYDIYISNTVLVEVDDTKDQELKDKLLEAIKKYNLRNYNIITIDVEGLATKYVKAGIIPDNKFDDALHIAFATYHEFDILLSWNFRHIANIKKQLLVNSFNKNEGYLKELLLLNPLELIYEKRI